MSNVQSDATARTEPREPSGRADWLDAAKGAMIIFVVFGHTWRGAFHRGLLPETLFTEVDSRIYAFHMPVFFALAGWFYISSLAKRPLPVFIRKQLTGLLWPMFLWTYIFFSIKAFAGPLANSPVSFLELLTLPIPGKAHLWFLWALLIMKFFFIWMKPILRDNHASWQLLSVAALAVIAVDLIAWPAASVKWTGNAWNYLMFFCLGMILGQGRWPRIIPLPAILLATACFCIALIYWPALKASGWSQFGSLCLTVCVLIMTAAIGPVAKTSAARFLCWLGAGSMAIYLAHTIFAAGLREALLWADVDNSVVHIALGTLVGLLAPMVLLKIARLAKVDRVLGF